MHFTDRDGRCGGRHKGRMMRAIARELSGRGFAGSEFSGPEFSGPEFAGREFAGRFGGPFGEGGPFGGQFGGSGGGRRGHGGPFGRPGGRRRRFDAEALRLVVLKLIQDEPRHGYDIIRAMDELSGGAYAPSPGVVYPMLSLLAEMGLIAEAEGDSSRRSFALTEDGAAYLVANADDAEAALARLKALKEAAGADPAPVRRAMGNLAAVLQAKLAEPGADKARLLEVAALIDEAAQKIERL